MTAPPFGRQPQNAEMERFLGKAREMGQMDRARESPANSETGDSYEEKSWTASIETHDIRQTRYPMPGTDLGFTNASLQ